jgi:hypothetical protein
MEGDGTAVREHASDDCLAAMGWYLQQRWRAIAPGAASFEIVEHHLQLFLRVN